MRLRAPEPSVDERYCAWFGDARDGILYFGMAPFWSALHASGGDPRADLERAGPQPVGRFDLGGLRFLSALDVGAPGERGGVWDVLAHPDGRIFFTTYFGFAGAVDPVSGRVERFAHAGRGLNELALGPAGTLLATRYALDEQAGAVLVLDAAGKVLAEHILGAAEGFRAAAKSVAWDPLRQEIWVNTDLLPLEEGAIGHDVRVLAADGSERLRFAEPEVQFMVFGADGTGYFAEREGSRLRLRVRAPRHAGSPLLPGRIVPLDDHFPADRDFVQELRAEPDGSLLVARWSGVLHVVGPDGSSRQLTLPREDGGLYYTAVAHDGRVCATYCDDVSIVCSALR